MTKKEYNGWTNYETWCVSLWMDNEEGTQDYWLERADNCLGAARHDDNPKDNAIYDLSIAIKEEHEEAKPDALACGVFCDLITAAMSEVNWREIAKHFIEMAIENQEYEQKEAVI